MIDDTLEINTELDNIDHIAQSNSSSSLDPIGITRHKTITLYCGDHGHIKIIKLKCSDRTCQECRDKTYLRLLKGWFKLAENMSHPKLMTLTIKNTLDLKREYIRTLRDQFIRLLHRKYYKDRIIGGLYVLELVNTGNGWHIHIHALIDTKAGYDGILLQEKLSRDWLAITGDSMVVDIRKVLSPRGGLKYILKYLTKAPQINGENELYNEVLKKTRLIQTFGRLYGSKAEKLKMLCPECGCDWWISDYEIKEKLFLFNKESNKSNLRINNQYG